MDILKCYGCGVTLQQEDKTKIGYVPKNTKNKDGPMLCLRCFQLQHYHKIEKTTMANDDFLHILQNISETNSLVVYIIDIFDFNGSIIRGLARHIDNDLIVVANKRDILPKSLSDRKIIHWLQKQLHVQGIKPLDVLLTSGKKNYQLDALLSALDTYRKGRDVYVIGVTNVGKSSLINALLKHYSNETNTFITTSELPGTTLDLIAIPLDDKSFLYDTPGIINMHQIAHKVAPTDLASIMPSGELRPKTYQLQSEQTLYFGGLARMDFISGNPAGYTCYFSRSINVHRTKTKKADALYNTHQTLSPCIQEITKIEDMKTYEFTLPKAKVDIVISGLGFITTKNPKAIIAILAPKGVSVVLRESLL